MNIVVIDRSAIFRMGMMSVLNGMSFAGKIIEAKDLESAIPDIETNEVDLAIVEYTLLAGSDGSITLTSETFGKPVKIISIAGSYEEMRLPKLLKSDVSGILLKDIENEELLAAINLIMKGERYICHEISKSIINRVYPEKVTRSTRDHYHLTKRELEIMKLMCEDMSNQEIAKVLFISPRTVDGHQTNIINKLGVKSKVGLLRYALKNNILSL